MGKHLVMDDQLGLWLASNLPGVFVQLLNGLSAFFLACLDVDEIFGELADQIAPWNPDRQLQPLQSMRTLDRQDHIDQMRMGLMEVDFVMNAGLLGGRSVGWSFLGVHAVTQ